MDSKKRIIHIVSEDHKIAAAADQTILEALIGAGLILRSDCGGAGRCGKCRVKITGASAKRAVAPDATEKKHLQASELAAGYRLACRLRVAENVSLEIPPASRLSAEVVAKGLPTLFSKLAGMKKASPGGSDAWGLAVDLGTTTIAVYLCNPAGGKVVASTSARNPQSLFGDDVMSRIGNVSSTPRLLERLQTMAVRTIEWAAISLCRAARIDPAGIANMVVVGNPTMIHLFAGENPASIGIYPYRPAFVEAKTMHAASLGVRFNPEMQIRTLPLITGFIGADIVSAALASELSSATAGTVLVDVGTNGEIMLLGKEGLIATSCATGPAFEGAVIRHGMQAVSGAIDAVKIDATSGKTICSVIQRDPDNPRKVAGICGTGVISAVAALLRAGLILKDGAFDRRAESPGLQSNGNGGLEFILAPAEDTLDGEPVTLTQKDVRAVQLAKGALRAGMDLLCREAGMQQPTKLLVAGAFGSFIDKADAVTIGMFPRIDPDTIEVVGNAAGAGAVMALFDETFSARAAQLTRATRVLDLSLHPDFQDTFIDALAFPRR